MCRFALSILIALLGVFLSSCTSNPQDDSNQATKDLPAKDPVAKIESRGGLCPQNLGCMYTFTIYRNGSYERQLGGEKEPKTGTFSLKETRQLDTLVQEVKQEDLVEGEFTGVCPIAADGQEFIYTLYQADTKLVLETCTWDINESHRFFQLLRQLQLQSDYS